MHDFSNKPYKLKFTSPWDERPKEIMGVGVGGHSQFSLGQSGNHQVSVQVGAERGLICPSLNGNYVET